VDYVHYNPVKHGLVRQVADWPWSTYHRYVKDGFYGKADDFDVAAGMEAGSFGE